MSGADEVLDQIDQAVNDHAVSRDAMRCAPVPDVAERRRCSQGQRWCFCLPDDPCTYHGLDEEGVRQFVQDVLAATYPGPGVIMWTPDWAGLAMTSGSEAEPAMTPTIERGERAGPDG